MAKKKAAPKIPQANLPAQSSNIIPADSTAPKKVPPLMNSSISNNLIDNFDLIQAHRSPKDPISATKPKVLDSPKSDIKVQLPIKENADSVKLQASPKANLSLLFEGTKLSSKASVAGNQSKNNKLISARLRKSKLEANSKSEIDFIKKNEKIQANFLEAKIPSTRIPSKNNSTIFNLSWSQPIKLFGQLISNNFNFYNIRNKGSENNDSIYSVPWLPTRKNLSTNIDPASSSDLSLNAKNVANSDVQFNHPLSSAAENIDIDHFDISESKNIKSDSSKILTQKTLAQNKIDNINVNLNQIDQDFEFDNKLDLLNDPRNIPDQTNQSTDFQQMASPTISPKIINSEISSFQTNTTEYHVDSPVHASDYISEHQFDDNISIKQNENNLTNTHNSHYSTQNENLEQTNSENEIDLNLEDFQKGGNVSSLDVPVSIQDIEDEQTYEYNSTNENNLITSIVPTGYVNQNLTDNFALDSNQNDMHLDSIEDNDTSEPTHVHTHFESKKKNSGIHVAEINNIHEESQNSLEKENLEMYSDNENIDMNSDHENIEMNSDHENITEIETKLKSTEFVERPDISQDKFMSSEIKNTNDFAIADSKNIELTFVESMDNIDYDDIKEAESDYDESTKEQNDQEILSDSNSISNQDSKDSNNSLPNFDDHSYAFNSETTNKKNSEIDVSGNSKRADSGRISLENIPFTLSHKNKSEFEVHLSPRSNIQKFNIWPTKDMYEVSQNGVLTSIFKRPSDKLAELQNQSEGSKLSQKKLKIDDYNSFSNCLTALSKKKRSDKDVSSNISRRARLLNSRPYLGIGYGDDCTIYEDIKLPYSSTHSVNDVSKKINNDSSVNEKDKTKTSKKSTTTPKSSKRKSVTAKVLMNIINEVPSNLETSKEMAASNFDSPNISDLAGNMIKKNGSNDIITSYTGKSNVSSDILKATKIDNMTEQGNTLRAPSSVYVEIGVPPATTPFKFIRKDAAQRRKASLFESISSSSISGFTNASANGNLLLPEPKLFNGNLSTNSSNIFSLQNGQQLYNTTNISQRPLTRQSLKLANQSSIKRHSSALAPPVNIDKNTLSHSITDPDKNLMVARNKKSRNTIFSYGDGGGMQSSESPFFNTMEIKRKSRSSDIGTKTIFDSTRAALSNSELNINDVHKQNINQLGNFKAGFNQVQSSSVNNSDVLPVNFTKKDYNLNSALSNNGQLAIGDRGLGKILEKNFGNPTANTGYQNLGINHTLQHSTIFDKSFSKSKLNADSINIDGANAIAKKSQKTDEITFLRSTVSNIDESELPQFDFKGITSKQNAKKVYTGLDMASLKSKADTSIQQKPFKFEFSKLKESTVHLLESPKYRGVYNSAKLDKESELPMFKFIL
ncbi:hypothetical protein BB561_005784 [Smittium simulii]|uniref:Uncharacterized protein n=1 Tax=Smittium simulii TaxID=133385 RepID=A0A2T9Y888_9FUNG|nr:hypothetical protein BB561_005784 [Smittium simulii]